MYASNTQKKTSLAGYFSINFQKKEKKKKLIPISSSFAFMSIKDRQQLPPVHRPHHLLRQPYPTSKA